MTNNSRTLPPEFLRHTEEIFGQERFARFLEALDEEPPVSIRLNTRKMKEGESLSFIISHFSFSEAPSPVPWCADGFYLPERPTFTFDPLLHAGCYYVQEAASQFIEHVAKCIKPHHQPLPRREGREGKKPPLPGEVGGGFLDLCAAPGGKSTALRSVLPDDCLLVCNEPIRKRAQILSENIQKWGHPNCIVTNNYPKDFLPSFGGVGGGFDLILCDVPCSGEGMFRKDPAAIGEWSPQNVERCWQLQRQIVADIWPCLRPGGIMIYSTCTFNTHENEENVRWIAEHFGAESIDIPTLPDWHICGSLLPGFSAPVYRFIPGVTRSEGLFVAVLRKPDDGLKSEVKSQRSKVDGLKFEVKSLKSEVKSQRAEVKRLRVMEESPCAEALSMSFDASSYPVADLSYADAIAYLRRQAIVLPPDTPRGLVVVSYQGHPLGMVKNIGSRANNLYPREWAIRSTHTPQHPYPFSTQ